MSRKTILLRCEETKIYFDSEKTIWANVSEKTTLPMDLDFFFHWKISTLSISCDGNLLKLGKTAYARVHTLSTTSTHKSSQAVMDPSTYQKSTYSLNYRAMFSCLNHFQFQWKLRHQNISGRNLLCQWKWLKMSQNKSTGQLFQNSTLSQPPG